MADNENEDVEQEVGEEETEPTATENETEEQKEEEAAENIEGEAPVEDKPPSPEQKESQENAGEGEGAQDNEVAEEAVEGTDKPEGEGEGEEEKKEEEGKEGEDDAAGERPEGESAEQPDGDGTTVAAEANVDSSQVAEPDAVDAGGDGVNDADAAAETSDEPVAEGVEVTEADADQPPAEAAEGAEADSDVPKEEGTAEEPVKEAEEKTSEEKVEGEGAEAGAEDGADELTEEQKEAVAEAADREGSPIGERLSREATPDAIAAVEREHERLEATTPDKIDEENEYEMREEEEEGMVDEEEEEEETEEPAFRREDLIERYQDALSEREQLQQQNYALQHKLAEYFRKKKADERQDYDKNVTDQEQRYLKYMAQLEDLRRQYMLEKENYRIQIEDSKERCQDKKEKVDFERKKFMEFKKQVALNSVNSRSGKPIPPKDIEQYLVNEVKKEQEVVNVRLENIKLKNKLKKKEQQLKSKEELAEGLHLIDFEQLKIENQTYNEKIEERNEELLKLRKKITSTVQVLTHLKEKLQFVQGENLEQNKTLKEVESSLAQSRDVLSRTKQARDALRIDNQKLRQNCGLLGNELLLRDFEETKDEGDDLRDRLERLRMQHAELTLQGNQVRRKIEQARHNMP